LFSVPFNKTLLININEYLQKKKIYCKKKANLFKNEKEEWNFIIFFIKTLIRFFYPTKISKKTIKKIEIQQNIFFFSHFQTK